MTERTYTESEVVAIIEGVLRHKAQRAVEAEADGLMRQANLFHNEADGARYVLWEFVGFGKAMDAKERIYKEVRLAREGQDV